MNSYPKNKSFEEEKHIIIKKQLSIIFSGVDKYWYVFKEAPHQMDCEECTDLIDHRERRFALRTRNCERYNPVPNHWLNEITIRSKNKSNTETEITKIQEGYLDFYFYCWVDNDKIRVYHFFDAKKLIPLLKKYQAKARLIKNKDGTEGLAYSVEHLRDAIWSG